MNDVGVINRFLDTYNSYIDSGFGLVGGEVAFLTSALIVIDITLAGLFWAWGADEDIIQRLVKKTLYVGFFAFLISNFSWLAGVVFQSFAGLGLQASGAGMSLAEFMRPGAVAATGFDAGEPLLQAAGDLMGFRSFFANFVQIVVLIIAWLIILVAFFILAVQMFVTLIEFKLTTLAGFVLIPFALFNKTAFLAEKVLGNVIASGVKVLVLAVIVGIGSGLFAEFVSAFGGETPTAEQAMSVALAALALLGLSIFGPGIATGLVSGAPQLGAGAAVGTGLAAGGLAVVGVGGAGLAAGVGGRALAGAAMGGARMAGGAHASYGLASAGKSGASGVAAGLGGVGKAAGAGMSAPLRKAAAKVGESYREGGRSAITATGGTVGGAGSRSSASTGASPTGSPPAWAQSAKRQQAMSHGASAAAHAVRSGDRGGGGASVDLNQKD